MEGKHHDCFYERCVKIYDDYRAVVPPYAAAALSFYLLLILIPSFSLIAVGTSLLNIDMGLIESLIQRIVMPTYSQMLIDILESRSMNTVALITMIISIILSHAGLVIFMKYLRICIINILRKQLLGIIFIRLK